MGDDRDISENKPTAEVCKAIREDIGISTEQLYEFWKKYKHQREYQSYRDAIIFSDECTSQTYYNLIHKRINTGAILKHLAYFAIIGLETVNKEYFDKMKENIDAKQMDMSKQ